MQAKRDIYLHGALAATYGPKFSLAVSSPADAINALLAQLPGFAQAIRAGAWHIIRGPAPDPAIAIDARELGLGLGKDALHIVPALEGAGGDGKNVGKIILGTLLIAGAAFFSGGAFGAVAIEALGMTFGDIALFGASLLLGGVSAMMAPKPKVNVGGQDSRKDASWLFDGPVSRSEQGPPVPVGYGRLRVGAVLVSGGIDVVQEAEKGKKYEIQTLSGYSINDYAFNLTNENNYDFAVTSALASGSTTWLFEYGLYQSSIDSGTPKSYWYMTGGVTVDDGQSLAVPFDDKYFQSNTGWRTGSGSITVPVGRSINLSVRVRGRNNETEGTPMPGLGKQSYVRLKRTA